MWWLVALRSLSLSFSYTLKVAIFIDYGFEGDLIGGEKNNLTLLNANNSSNKSVNSREM